MRLAVCFEISVGSHVQDAAFLKDSLKSITKQDMFHLHCLVLKTEECLSKLRNLCSLLVTVTG